MKRATIIILSFLYIFVTCGVSINFHYCMGKLRSIDVSYSQKERCSKCGMSTKKSACCHDHIQWLKVNDNHQVANVDITFHTPVVDLAYSDYIQFTYIPFTTSTAAKVYSPPILLVCEHQDLNILHCIFRI